MKELVQKLQAQIHEINNGVIRNLLLNSLNIEATHHTELFTKQYPHNRKSPNHNLSTSSPLLLAFAYAPKEVWASLVQELSQLPQNLDYLKNTLNSYQSGFAEKILEYCDKYSDDSSYFMFNLAQGIDNSFLEPIVDFIAIRLQEKIDCPEKSPWITLQLIIFLFSMPIEIFSRLLNDYPFEPKLHSQLQSVLQQALLTPLLISSLDDMSYRLVYSLLTEDFKSSTAYAIFKYTNWVELAPNNLKEVANFLPTQKIFEYSKNSKNGILKVIVLQKMLSSHNIKELLEDFKQELFSRNTILPKIKHRAELLHLKQLLCLTEHELIKEIIDSFMEELPNDAPIFSKLNNLFLKWDNKTLPPKKSYLYDFFIKIMNTPGKSLDKTWAPGFEIVFSIAPVEEIKTLFLNYSKYQINSYETEQSLKKLCVTGLLKNPAWHSLLTPFLQWHLQSAHHHPEDSDKILAELLPRWLESASEKDHDEFNAFLNIAHKMRQEAQPAIQALENLLYTNCTKDALLQTLSMLDKNALIQLHAISLSIGKKDLDPAVEPREGERDIEVWLKKLLTDLNNWCNHTLSWEALKIALPGKNKDYFKSLSAFISIIQKEKAYLGIESIIIFIKSYENELTLDPLSEKSKAFVFALAQLLKKIPIKIQLAVFSRCSEDFLKNLTQHCLIGLSGDPIRSLSYRNLLNSLIQQDSSENIKLVKELIAKKDLDILDTNTLSDMAEDILKENKTDVLKATFSGIWIQRLLTYPPFVASCSADLLQHLTERYRLISLALKKDELEGLNNALEMRSSPNLEKKRISVLGFKCDDSFRALCNELEENCNQYKIIDPLIAEKALNNLLSYYHKRISTLRLDILFNLSDYFYRQFIGNQGDITIAQNTLLNLLDRYLPHKNFEQRELLREQQTIVFNEEGEEIGFVNENNQVMTFIKGKLSQLLEVPTIRPGMRLYDKNAQCIGTITIYGQIKHENLFQKETSVSLLAKVDQKELKANPHTLPLLIQNLFENEALDFLYTHKELVVGSPKRVWVEQKIAKYIGHLQTPIKPKILGAVIVWQDQLSISYLWKNIKNPSNALTLFHGLLKNSIKRPLFLLMDQADFTAFLNKFGAVKFLQEYISNYHKEPWFHEGLSLFGNYAQEESKPDLLQQALQFEPDLKTVMPSLIKTEATARVVLKQFLHHKDPEKVAQLTAFFCKKDLIQALDSLNNSPNWKESYRYDLLLYIFTYNHESIFQSNEARFSTTYAWGKEDLSILTKFIKRHYRNTNPIDVDGLISYKILSELAFRTANAGLTDLFYAENNRLDNDLLMYTLKRSNVKALVAKYPLSKSIITTINIVMEKLHGFFDEQYAKNLENIKLLKSNNAYIEWEKLAEESWSQTDGTQLPLICAWIVQYSGPSQPLKKLLDDFFSKPSKRLEDYQSITRLLTLFPNKDFSKVIFSTLVKAVKDDPRRLTLQTFLDMAKYYGNNKKSAVMDLLQYFGQRQQYALVKKACRLLRKKMTSDELNKISLEAEVEQSLSPHMNCWYFPIFQFFVRLWNYGGNPSRLVSFCDAPLPGGHNAPAIPAQINSSFTGGQFINQEMKYLKNLKEFSKTHKDKNIFKPPKLYSKIGHFAQSNKDKMQEEPLTGVLNTVLPSI
jgi:hypothetical protein